MTISSSKVVERVKKEEPKQEPKTETSLKSKVAGEILKRLGTPENLIRVSVSDGVAESQAGRVDIWCDFQGRFMPQPRIEHSFYVRVTPEGEIIDSSPPIEKLDGI